MAVVFVSIFQSSYVAFKEGHACVRGEELRLVAYISVPAGKSVGVVQQAHRAIHYLAQVLAQGKGV